MSIALSGSQAFGFADGNAGHVITLPSAPAVGDLDRLCVNSDTTVSTPSGWTLEDSHVSNEGAYVFTRFAAGGESATVTITTAGDFNTQVGWSRWAGVLALDAKVKAFVDSPGAMLTPPVDTGALTATGELVVAFGALSGAVPNTPVWSTGFTGLTALTEGTGIHALTGYVGYKLNAGTAAEQPQVTWTVDVPARYIFVATYTPATPPFTPGTPLELAGELNRIARTSGLDAAGAANVYAGTSGLEVVGALNVKAGNTATTGYLDLQGVCNQLAGTTGLGTVLALSKIAPLP